MSLGDEVTAAVQRSKAEKQRAATSATATGIGALVDSPDDSVLRAPVPSRYEEEDLGPGRSRRFGYVEDIMLSFLFFSSPGNIITFVITWLLISFGQVILTFGVLGMVGKLIIFGWYTAFRLNCIVDAAAGEEDLPTISMENGWVEDIIIPVGHWIGSWLAAFSPALLYLMFKLSTTSMDSLGVLKLLFGGLPGWMGAAEGDLSVLRILIIVGLFLWPIIVLCVSLGGFPTLARIDLIVKTLFNTIHAYVATVIVVFGAFFLDLWLSGILANKMIAPQAGAGTSSLLGAIALWVVVVTAVEVYFEVIAMRAIGLYYHHFKKRFAWSWG
ncbi:MAG: hypothetical protein AABZ47_04355 [Planctomycetota bacterium]